MPEMTKTTERLSWWKKMLENEAKNEGKTVAAVSSAHLVFREDVESQLRRQITDLQTELEKLKGK